MSMKIAAFSCVLATGLLSQGQTAASPDAPAEKPRVFITDSQSWEMEGSAGGSGGTFAAHSHGGARPQTAEIVKTFGDKCPSVTVNNLREKASYIVVLDHEGGKGALRHKNKVAVFDAQSGDSIVSKSTLSLGGSVEEACRGIARHWADHKPAPASADDSSQKPASVAKLQPAVAMARAATPQVNSGAHFSITSVPDGAEIEIDGSFMGNAPSSLLLEPGDHKVVIRKSGYKAWDRTLKVSGGDVNIKAELEKN
jgi:hypothetical protein